MPDHAVDDGERVATAADPRLQVNVVPGISTVSLQEDREGPFAVAFAADEDDAFRRECSAPTPVVIATRHGFIRGWESRRPHRHDIWDKGGHPAAARRHPWLRVHGWRQWSPSRR